jgi:hypothetical protein
MRMKFSIIHVFITRDRFGEKVELSKTVGLAWKEKF